MSGPPAAAVPARRRRRGGPGRVGWPTYLLLVGCVVVAVLPLYVMFVIATNGSAAATTLPPRLHPGDRLLAMAELVLRTVPFLQSLVNSVVVSTVIGVGQALLCALAGFAFAKLRFRGRDALFGVVVLTMAVPATLSVIPQYLIMSWLGWVDSLQAVIVPGLASAFGIFWMRQHIATVVDDELLQAARLDGCGSWRIFWGIVLPVVRPVALVLGLLGFVSAWNDFMWPFIVLKSQDLFTVQLAIKALQSQRSIDLGLAMAGSFLATLPLLVVLVFVGRRLVGGIMDGAIRG